MRRKLQENTLIEERRRKRYTNKFSMGINDDEANNMLLPTRYKTVKSTEGTNKLSEILFKFYVIVAMTFLWTGYTLTVRYTRSIVPVDELYAATTVVLSAEIIKLIVSTFMMFKESHYKYVEFRILLGKYYFGAPRELLKMSVPSIAYAFQNNLDFVGLSNLDAGLYQIYPQSGNNSAEGGYNSALHDVILRAKVFYYTMGGNFSALCWSSCSAGVYFEKMLKDGGSTPFWIRNLQMYSCGVVNAALGCLFTEGYLIYERGFFYGYTNKVYAIIGFLSFGGVYISLVMKYLDNLHKSFASAISIILVVILSFFIFNDVFIGPYFVLGTGIVVLAVILYNYASE
uniref:CMP-sialic acid transporter n=1 Tax=Heterorhabditis bacteriophora TaxID=37862 RepID=A0A1I7X6H2_HETBA